MNVKTRHAILKKGFREAFEMLPRDQKKILARRMQDRIGWSVATFYKRMRGDLPSKMIEMKLIDKTFKEFDIDIWAVTKN